jgi:hypothetical protein
VKLGVFLAADVWDENLKFYFCVSGGQNHTLPSEQILKRFFVRKEVNMRCPFRRNIS